MGTLTEGSQLGRYRILRRLGAGSMGEVYLAEDPQIGRRLAVKTVRVEEGRPREVEERKQRLLREARAAGKLLHPRVVTLFDAGEDQGVLYLAFEWVEGSDLEQRLAEGPPLTLAEALSIVRQAAEGLDAAHRQGVVHRDIKPSNLMLTSDGRVKVADFGIAKVIDSTSDLTMTGSVVGSPHYLSPEQVRGDELDGRTDVFSLGVMLYELLCQRRPFEGETLTTLVYQILHHTPPSIAARRPDLGPRLVRLVERMMHKDREHRIATAAEVVAEIEACERELLPAVLGSAAAPSEVTIRLPPEPSTEMRSTPAPAAPSAVAAAPSPSSRSRWIGLAVAALAILALIAAVGLGARRWVAGRAESAAQQTEVAAPRPSQVAAARPSQAAPAGSATAAETSVVEAPPAEPLAVSPDPAPAPVEAPAPPAVEPPPFVPGERGAVPTTAPPPESPPVAAAASPAPPATPVAAVAAPLVAAAPASEAAAAATPAASETAAPAAPVAAAARELRDAFVASLPVAREMETAMALSLEIQPKEVAERVVVRLDRIVLGRAADWNASRRGGRAYSVPEPGLHILSFHLDGAEVYRIRIDAQPGRSGPTKIAADLPGQVRRPRRRPGG